MNEYFMLGLALGISAGFSPGPLSALIISETLMYGYKAGLRVCFAPLFTDVVIVPLSILLLSTIKNHLIIAIIAFLGAIYVSKLGWENITFNGQIKLNLNKTRSLKKGIITNFLSPNPYLFWITIGGPIFIRGNATGKGGYLFIASFYLAMIPVKILISTLTAKSREFIKGKAFIYTIKFTGLLLFLLAVFLLKTGVEIVMGG